MRGVHNAFSIAEMGHIGTSAWLLSCQGHCMANLQIKDMPDTLHERLRRYARENNCTMRAVVIAAIERELARWEWRKHLAQRPETCLTLPPSLGSLFALRQVRRCGRLSANVPPACRQASAQTWRRGGNVAHGRTGASRQRDRMTGFTASLTPARPPHP